MHNPSDLLSVIVPKDLKRRVRLAAAQEEISISEWVRATLVAALEADPSFFASPVHEDAQ